jgi:hypothetical protein
MHKYRCTMRLRWTPTLLFELQKAVRWPSSPHSIFNMTTQLIKSPNKPPPLRELCPHIINGFLQDNTLASALPFQSGHQFSESIEAFPNCLPPFLLYTLQLAITKLESREEEKPSTCQKRYDLLSSHARKAVVSPLSRWTIPHSQTLHAEKSTF